MNENNIKIKNNAIIHKDNSLNRLDLSFLKHIELEEYKKSELLAYWINDFAVYHDEERNFNISKSGVFSRGDIIKVNLGFNIGNELGGLHYCVVLGKYDNTRNGTLNVVPLTSKKPNKKYDSSTVNLGNELYILLQEKLDKEKKKLKQILDELEKIEDSIALINQITTISKQRIFNDTLRRNVKLSNNSLDLIDKQIIKYFTK